MRFKHFRPRHAASLTKSAAAYRRRHAGGNTRILAGRAPGNLLPKHLPMRAGEPLTDFRLVGPGALAGYGESAVLATVRVDRSDVAALRVGDRVDVVGVAPGGETPAEVVARGVEVATVPRHDEAESVALGVVTTEEGALALARAQLTSRLTVITSSA